MATKEAVCTLLAALLSQVTFAWSAPCGESAPIIGREPAELRDVEYTLTSRWDSDTISETVGEISILDSRHYRIRNSRVMQTATFEGNRRTLKSHPVKETLRTANGSMVWMETATVDSHTHHISYSLTSRAIAKKDEQHLTGVLQPIVVKMIMEKYDPLGSVRSTYEGRPVIIFTGTRKPERFLSRSRDPDRTLEVVFDVETGVVFSLVARGGDDVAGRPTKLFRMSNIKWNAGLEKKQFAYTPGRTTEAALEDAVAKSKRPADLPSTVDWTSW